MSFDKSRLYLIPEQIQSKVKELLNNSNRREIRENYAQQLEVIRDFCSEALSQYKILTEIKNQDFNNKQFTRKTKRSMRI